MQLSGFSQGSFILLYVGFWDMEANGPLLCIPVHGGYNELGGLLLVLSLQEGGEARPEPLLLLIGGPSTGHIDLNLDRKLGEFGGETLLKLNI